MNRESGTGAFRKARRSVFLSGSRDVANLLAQAYEVIDRVGSQDRTSLKRAVPYYWEFAEDQDRQTIQLIDLPRSTDPSVRAVVFIFGNRLGAPVPSDQALPMGFRLPSFIGLEDQGEASTRLTYTAFEFIDWKTENERRQANGEPPIPGFVYFLNRNWNGPATSDGPQTRWLDQFFQHYFGPNAEPLPGLRAFQALVGDADLASELFKSLAQEFEVPVQIPWRKALRGLQRFEVEDRHVYFGHEAKVQELATRLLASDAPCADRSMLLIGPNGIGKSSFLRAGVAGAALENRFHTIGFVTCICVTPLEMLPVNDPSRDPGTVLAQTITLAYAKLRADHDTHWLADAQVWDVDRLEQLIGALTSAERDARPEFRLADARSTFVFILDQAEQALDAMANGKAGLAFWTECLETLQILAQRGAIRLLCALSADRAEAWQSLDLWSGPMPVLELNRLSPDATEAVFRKVAKLCAISKPISHLDAFLVQAKKLIAARDEDAAAVLPLLSIALFGLFDVIEREDDPFPSGLPENYLVEAIENIFARALAPLHQNDHSSAARLLLRALVSFNAKTGQRQLLAASRAELSSPQLKTLWDQFVDLRILTDLGHGRFRLVHETVLDHWSLARDWLKEGPQLIDAFARFQSENAAPVNGASARAADRNDVRIALEFLTSGILDATNSPKDLRNQIEEFLRASYRPDMDIELEADVQSLAGLFVEAGLDEIVLATVESNAGDIRHLESGHTQALYAAIFRGDKTMSAQLLSLGCDPNRPNWNGWRPIHVAADQRRLDLIALLLSHGADPTVIGPGEQSIVALFLKSGSLDELRKLLNLLAAESEADLTKDSSLMAAVAQGDTAKIGELITRGWPLDYCANTGVGLLHQAAISGHSEVIEDLLARGLDPFATAASGHTPIHFGIYGNVESFSRLTRGIAPSRLAGLDKPWTLLAESVSHSNPEMIDYLTAIGAVDPSGPGLVTLAERAVQSRKPGVVAALFRTLAGNAEFENLRYRLLFEAIRADDCQLVRAMSQQEAALVAPQEGQQSPLNFAVSEARHGSVDILLDHGADPTVSDEMGNTALHLAADSGEVQIVKLLLNRTKDLNIRNRQGETALCRAVRNMHNVVVQELLAAGADVELGDGDEATPLHHASASGALVAAGIILTRTGNPNPRDRFGRTPLHYAASAGQHRIIRVLLDYAADRNAQDQDEAVPLIEAARNGHLEAVTLLLEDRRNSPAALVDQRDSFGWTALHVSIWSGHAPVTQALIAQGADVKLATARPAMTPVQIASEIGAPDVLRLLLEKGADAQASTHDKSPAVELALANHSFECAYLLLRREEPIDGARISACAAGVWHERRKRWPNADTIESLVFNELIRRGILPEDYRSTNDDSGYLELFGRLVDASADPWKMSALLPGAWRIPNVTAAAARILSATLATKVPAVLVDRIDGLREMELACLSPSTTLIECRLKTEGDRAESLVFLSAKSGFLQLSGAERPNSLPGCRVDSANEEYLRLFLSTHAMYVNGWMVSVLDSAQSSLHASALDADDLRECRDLRADIRLTAGTASSVKTQVATCVARVADAIIDCELLITAEGSIKVTVRAGRSAEVGA